MAFNKAQSRQDTGWGLIYRLNGILGKIETDIENSDMKRWNLHLDRVFINIVYKNPEEKVLDDDGKIIDIKLSNDDMEVFSIFNSKIKQFETDINTAKQEENKQEVIKLTNQLYSLLQKKDIWIRKKMFQLKLYLREGESDPRKAIYSGY